VAKQDVFAEGQQDVLMNDKAMISLNIALYVMVLLLIRKKSQSNNGKID